VLSSPLGFPLLEVFNQETPLSLSFSATHMSQATRQALQPRALRSP